VAPPAFQGTIRRAVLHGKLGAADAVAGANAAPSASADTAGTSSDFNFMVFSSVNQPEMESRRIAVAQRNGGSRPVACLVGISRRRDSPVKIKVLRRFETRRALSSASEQFISLQKYLQ
jgi:hypothetical protein